MRLTSALDSIFRLAESAPKGFRWDDAMSWSPEYQPGDDPDVEDDHDYLTENGWAGNDTRDHYTKTVPNNVNVTLKKLPASGRWELGLPSGPSWHDWPDDANKVLNMHQVLFPKHYE